MVEVFWVFVSYMNLFSVGFNCVLGVEEMCLYLEVLFKVVICFVSVYFNVGLFNEFGEYD